ncbi:MAG: hypothetical protein AAFQ21_08420 [Pseudomonadota bacterium]
MAETIDWQASKDELFANVVPEPALEIVIGDPARRHHLRTQSVLELHLTRELSQTSNAFLRRLIADVQSAFGDLKPLYVYQACIEIAFEVDADMVPIVKDKIEAGALDSIAARYDCSRLTLFNFDTAIHTVMYS